MTGLNHFTLSHCGSRTPLPTLKPGLTASAPRLSTSCLPSFTGLGVSPNYTTRTEPAHPCTYYTANRRSCLDIAALFNCSGDIILAFTQAKNLFFLGKIINKFSNSASSPIMCTDIINFYQYIRNRIVRTSSCPAVLDTG